MPDRLNDLLEASHEGITEFDFEGKKTPCIIFEEGRFDSILREVAGKPIHVETDLNILQDGLGHVFVEMSLVFSKGDFAEKILINANKHLGFFELLAETSILCISSPKASMGVDNVFMIQLPRRARIGGALNLIRDGLENRPN